MSDWPELKAQQDHDTLSVLHLASQMLGKMRIAHAPWANHGWHAALQPVGDGFETLPTDSGDARTFTLRLDLCHHAIVLSVSDGAVDRVSLELGTIARIHERLVAMLDQHRLPATFNGMPNEIEGAVAFRDDTKPREYSHDSAARLRKAFAAMLPTFERLRAGFCGKSSPVQLWWGSFDLAVSRFTGRSAPMHPGGVPGLPDRVTREAYSHEVSSSGFWAGGATAAEPFFYAYFYPEPEGYREGKVAHGRFDQGFGEFILPYEEVRAAREPETMLAAFFGSAYDLGADLAQWDREHLERKPVAP